MPMWRLDKIISSQTSLSRKEVKAMIAEGRVRACGKTALRPEEKFDTDSSSFAVDGKELVFKRHLYLILNKPLGYVSSTSGKDGLSVLSLVPAHLRRGGLFPAGRLDKYSEGMLIITDDGDFAHEMLSPKRHVPKRYYVEVDKPIIDDALAAAFARGVDLGDETTKPAALEAVTAHRGFVTINQGMFHQVRRMFSAFGAEVLKLERVKIGELALGDDLPRGECAELNREQVELLLKAGPERC